ncbi:hypothetical protein CFK37_14080 [Virgibacillus phasianinus]|uniref:Uncharacterized protein n=1 Tax=Virgibacillus phasianinus TaxID=2017483 RepID=A0A220U4J5_9BACI|nr:hypothetical protein [Virgibacillus phasianinus]ASK63194.1 hypothetical protein CFK37_14080 [Virgibacillus phasianinus]
MKKYLVLSIFLILSIFFVFLYQTKLSSIPSISYFPLDKETHFVNAKTNLDIKKQKVNKKYTITWNVLSKSDKNMYLRQDVSLLFNNGKLMGALSKWHEDEETLQLNAQLQSEGTGYLQSLSYHHGEIHYPSGAIKSIQQMTYDEIFVVENPAGDVHTFHKPKSTKDIDWEKALNDKTSQFLLYHWNKLLSHYQIKKDDYVIVPLTALNRFNTNELPSMSQEQTNQIIGQLWEGLYKNYIVPITYKKEQVSSFVPIILFSKDQNHLLVLFEINGKKERLIQKY